ncbi:type II toxin-antitoxin system RelE/ParE family toxin [Fusibacter ferrireducens]|uniref:type II toxin-antitoxin system RelE/ParE family toxin n=1 Tax=Fusibacter ferrireducens TaxID=2785058 RepID=UPI002B48D48B|nr:type II toxin-antitoxin system RelE/ParE family toxin [Fusibacter ferrireducens]
MKYKSNKLERVCTNYSFAKKEYGDQMAILIHQRIDQIRSATSVEMLVQFSIGRCHPLRGNRKGEYAMDLVQPYRMIFEQKDKKIQVVRIIKIEDYH